MRPQPREGVEDLWSTSAEEFLDALSPRHQLWREDPTSWVFRGQADADWELKPAGQRDARAFERFGVGVGSELPGYTSKDDCFERVGRLNRLLERFRKMLEQAGVHVPVDSPSVVTKQDISSNIEPPPQAYALMALAQHHGLPTFLLDWSRRAWVAAYFAAVDAADEARRGTATHLAVWAIRRGDLLRTTEGPNFYEAPGSTNPNLQAQGGLFSFIVTEDGRSLEQHHARLLRLIKTALPLRRACLPVSEAAKLLRLLSYEGINGSSMFPGADGVVRAMRETALWDIPKR